MLFLSSTTTSNIYGIMALVSLAILFVPYRVAKTVMKERPSRGQSMFLLTICAILIVQVSNVFKILAISESAVLNAYKMGMVGKLLCLLWLPKFCSEFFHFSYNKIIDSISGVVATISFVIVFTIEYNTIFFRSYYLSRTLDIPKLNFEPGIFYISLVLYGYSVFAFVLINILQVFKNQNEEEKKRYASVIIGFVIAAVTLGMDILSLTGGFDVLPYGLVITCFVFYRGLMHYKMFDISYNAKEYVLDQSDEAVWVLDSEFHMLYENKTAMEFDSNQKRFFVAKDKITAETSVKEFAYENKYYEEACALLKRPDGKVEGYLFEVRDVTKKHEDFETMNELMERAEKANQTKSQFLNRMSHDIRTPIHAVMGINELILREEENDTILDYAVNIKNAGNTLVDIVNDILDLSKIETGKIELINQEYDLNEMIANLRNMIIPRLEGKPIKFEADCRGYVPAQIYGDGKKIQQVITNILTNAAKYTDVGMIKLQVDSEGLMPPNENLRIGDVKLIISVEDTGKGIKEEDLPHLFASYTRVDEENNVGIEGTGLGLSITKKMVEYMGGTIRVESEYGKGSIFTVVIPQKLLHYSSIGFQKEQNGKHRVIYEKKGAFVAPEAKVLVVDDNEVNLKVIQGLLRRTEVSVTLVNSGEKCLEVVKDNDFDMIFMDHMMPGMDGIEAFHRIREMLESPSHNCPVVALTANAIQGSRELFLEEGFSDYLSKPLDVRELERIMMHFISDNKVHQL